MTERARYVDPRTGRHHGLSERRWRSDDGNPMLVTPLPGIGRDDIDSRTRSLTAFAGRARCSVKPGRGSNGVRFDG